MLMSHDPMAAAPVTSTTAEAAALQAAERALAAEAALPPPSPEQVRTADEVFSHSQESRAVAGVLGLWTGALLLHDLAVEHFESPPEEDEEPEARPDPEPDATAP
jgi:hypothetical protein